jgi:hypothetical protein
MGMAGTSLILEFSPLSLSGLLMVPRVDRPNDDFEAKSGLELS